MEGKIMNVLLIGEDQRSWWQIAQHLEKQGCLCWFAPSMDAVARSLGRHSFALVLSKRPVTEGSPLMELLGGTAANVFYSFPIAGSCLWFQAAPDARGRMRSAAFRPSEFGQVLDRVIAECQMAECREAARKVADQRSAAVREEGFEPALALS